MQQAIQENAGGKIVALLIKIHCEVCKKEKNVMVAASRARPTVCNACRIAKERQDERLHFLRLDGMTVRQRLREIEAWVYLHKNQRHYTPPGKF